MAVSKAASPPGRPVHPLFGGAGAKNELATAAKLMSKGQSPAASPRAAAPAPARPTARAPAPAASPPPARPPHPLFGGGGGDGATNKGSLNDQIKAMAAKRQARTSNPKSASSPAPKKQPTPPPRPKVPPSLADQVAEMAAKRKARLGDATDPVFKAPERTTARPVPLGATWMAPAEKYTSGPPPEPRAAPAPTPPPPKTITKTVTKTVPTGKARIIRKRIIKKADGSKHEIRTIHDAETGAEIHEDGSPVVGSTTVSTTRTTTCTIPQASPAASATRMVRKRIIKKADGSKQEIVTVHDVATGELISQ